MQILRMLKNLETAMLKEIVKVKFLQKIKIDKDAIDFVYLQIGMFFPELRDGTKDPSFIQTIIEITLRGFSILCFAPTV